MDCKPILQKGRGGEKGEGHHGFMWPVSWGVCSQGKTPQRELSASKQAQALLRHLVLFPQGVVGLGNSCPSVRVLHCSSQG
jgi:hypothetical protein